MDMKLDAFDPAEWFNIEPLFGTARDYGAPSFYILANAYQGIKGSWSYSVKAPAGLVASGGFLPVHPGVAEIWCATTGLALEGNGPALVQIMRRAVEHAMEAFDLRRVQATVEHADKRTARLVKLLGLEEETKPEGLKGFLPGGRAVRIFGRA